MNRRTLVILIAWSASIALADDFKTIKGKEYKNATVVRVEADGIVVRTKGGISRLYFTELPDDVQARFGHDPAKIAAQAAAARAAEEKRIEEQKTAERERAEREKNAEADLQRSLDQFQVAEQRAVEAYKNATKGSLSGQVFVSTEAGENFKLGAVQVSLFARDAIDVLLGGLRACADTKIQQLSSSVGTAKAAREQADSVWNNARQARSRSIGSNYYQSAKRTEEQARETATRTSEEYFKISRELEHYYSGGFYLSYLHSPIEIAETDADGRFAIEVPTTGEFVIAAQAERSVGDSTEHYYWLQPISLEGQQQHVQNLSNKNLTSTEGTSSLIHTDD